jgi:Zn-dependent protease with chaperone function
MGYLVHLLVALLAQGMAEEGWSTGWRWPLAALLLVPVPHAIGWGARRLLRGGRFRAGGVLARVLAGAAPVLHVVAVCVFGWADALKGWFGEGLSLSAWPRVGLLLVLLPFVVYELASIDARARLETETGTERRAWRIFQARMLLSGIVPLAGYVLISSAVGASETVRVEVEEVSLFAALFAGGLLLVLALLLPALLRNVWATEPLPSGAMRAGLQAVADRAGFRSRALLAWNTGDLMANAAIVGIGPRTRIVLFSDSLLARLDGEEVAAVFAHEIGHAARRHVLIFVAWAAAFFLLADLAANHLFPSDAWVSGGFVLVALVVWVLGFGFASRRFELEADLFCLELLGDASALIRALEKVGGRFRDVASWRHFSTADRVRFLERASAEPRIGDALRRALRRWARLGFVLLAVALVLQAWSLARSFPAERVRADLRLGRYASARARAEGIPALDPHLAELTARAASLGRDRVAAADLEMEARAAMARNDFQSGLGWLDLAALRGSSDLGAVADAFRAIAEKDAVASDLLPSRVYASWRTELEAFSAGARKRTGSGDQ